MNTPKYKKIVKALTLAATAVFVLGGCSDSYLDPKPLSIYEPTTTYSTESGLMSSMAACDKQMKLYYATPHNEVLDLATEYIFSEMMVGSATDQRSMLTDVSSMLTPTSDQSNEHNTGRTNSIAYFWNANYEGIKYANTIIQYAPQVKSLDEATRNAYIGRAYFHRAFRYYALVFQFGDVPLVTKILEVPKQNYKSTKRDAILAMLVHDMKLAVQWVPEQKNMAQVGMVNKGACRMLLAKLLLATGDFQGAKEQLDIIIDQSGYQLMTEPFGQYIDTPAPECWHIQRNVIWDVNRAENKLIPENKEVIMGIPNSGSDKESFSRMLTMRILYPGFFNTQLKTTDGYQAMLNLNRHNKDYEARYDYMRAIGRGQATFRFTYYMTHGCWRVNGHEDPTDLRHDPKSGNWVYMDSLYCNNKNSVDYGKHIRLYDDNGNLLCTDTLRHWFDFPHYKLFLQDPVNEANIDGSNGNRGATSGGCADWYLYRLPEAYLLRAEAKFYINPTDPTIADDVNIIRRRAHCTEMYQPGKVTIGDIMDERARELFFEEWRNVELTRVSLCLAISGRPDEWGNTYNVATFDKQEGTDATGGSYWYQRINHLSMYNKGPIHIVSTGQSNPNFVMNKHNIYWPIPNKAITANNKGQLHQNFGYDGYDENCDEWDNWEDAVADEDKTE